MYSKNSELPLSCQQPVEGNDLKTRNRPGLAPGELGSSVLEEGLRPLVPGWKNKGAQLSHRIGLQFKGARDICIQSSGGCGL